MTIGNKPNPSTNFVMIIFNHVSFPGRKAVYLAAGGVGLVLLAGMAGLRAGTVYDSGGFEPPRFPASQTLAGQDAAPPPPLGYGPWHQDTGTSTAVAQTDSPGGGLQSIKVTRAANPTGDTRWGINVPITPTAASNVVVIDFDLNATVNPGTNWGGPDLGPFFGIECYDASLGSPKMIGSLLLDAYSGDVFYQQAGTGALLTSGEFIPRNEYHHYTLSANFTAKTYSIYVDGRPVHTEGFVDATAAAFTDAPITALAATTNTVATATGTAYFDNYVISATTSRLNHLVWRGDGVNNIWDAGVSSNWFNGDGPDVFSNNVPVVFDDNGSNTPAITLQGALQPGSITVNGSQPYTFGGSGSLGGSANLTKRGNGTLTLTGNNSYSGGTVVSNGTLLVNNTSGSGTGTGSVSIGAGATLGGSGSIAGLVTVADGGTLSPGNGVGTLTLNGSLTLAGDAALQYELGTSSDHLVISGNLMLDGVLNISDAGGFGTGTYTLVTYGGTLTDQGVRINNAPAGYDYSLNKNTPGQLNLVVSTPPPPPAAPGGLTATATSSTQINLVWTDNSSNETGFLIERSPDNFTFTQIAATGPDATSYPDTGLASSTTYYYRVRASNSGGNSAYSMVASATTKPSELIAWYEFEGNANDSSGNGFDGTGVNLQYGGGEVGPLAARFDGTTSFVNIPRMIGTNFSVSMWLKTTDTGGTGTSWTTGKGLLDAESSGAGAPLRPAADASIQESVPAMTRGADTLLAMSGSGQQNIAYLRFDLSGFSTITPGTTLTVYNTTGSMTWSTTQVEIYGLLNSPGNTSQNWSESALTYNSTGMEIPKDGNPNTQDLDFSRLVFLGNLPALLSTAVSVPLAFTSTNFDSFIAQRLADGGQVTLLIVNRNNSGRNLIFQSKETGDGSSYTGPSLAVNGTPTPENGWGAAVLNSKFVMGIGSPNTTIATGIPVNDGTWHHVAASRDANSGLVRLYVDGVLNAFGIAPAGSRTATSSLHIGNSQSGSPAGFLNGSIDDVKIYNRVVSDAELAVMAGRTTHIAGISRQGANVVVSGDSGPPKANYYVLTSTNLTLPLAQWTRAATNQFDGEGNCVYTNTMDSSSMAKFFMLQLP